MIRRPDFHILGDMLRSSRTLYATAGVEALLDTPAAKLLQQVSRSNLRRDMPADSPYGRAACPCGCGQFLAVERDVANRRYYVECGEACEEFTLPESDHHMWRINMPALIEFLHSIFKCREKCSELISGRLWRLGQATETLAGTNRIIFFAPKLDLDVKSKLPMEQTHSILILGENYPTTQISWGDRLLSLCDILTVSGQMLDIDFSRIESAVAPLIPPEKKEPVKKNANVLKRIGYLKPILNDFLQRLNAEYERTGEIIAQPTLKWLSDEIQNKCGEKINPATIGRILNEYCQENGCCPDMELRMLWQETTHPVMALNTKRSRRSKAKPISDDDDYSNDEYTMTEEEAFQTNGMRISKGV